MSNKPISSDFPFESKFIDVHGSKMHYIDEGEGDVVLFLHGNPTSSYLWRNIIPYLLPHTRCIAPDLIGMGKSDKPDLGYRLLDHAKYLEGFIEKLELTNITLVIHDWGSALGLHYAMRNEANIKGVAFMESVVKTLEWENSPFGMSVGFTLFRMPIVGWFMISVMNLFVKGFLPKSVLRKLTAEETAYYEAPYKKIRDRKPIRVWPCEIPIGGKPQDVNQLVAQYSEKFQASELPKLFFFVSPGLIFNDRELEWCRSNLKNLQVIDLGEGHHFLQEDYPHEIGEALAEWYQKI